MTLLGIDWYAKDMENIYDMGMPWDKLAGKSVLITGATGMICSCLAEFLLWMNREKGSGVRLLFAGRSEARIRERFSPFQEGTDYEYVPFDATSGEMPDVPGGQADFIVHGASNAHPALFGKEPIETMLANLYGTEALLRLAAKANSERFLFVSSSEVYGMKETNKPYSEDDFGYVDISDARSCYPCSKRGAETLCAAYESERGVDVAIVRPGHIYGPTMTDSDSRASAQFARCAANGEDIVMKSAGTQKRSYCYVTDCASAILAVLLLGERGCAYNISNPDSICTIRDLAEAFARVGGGRIAHMKPTDFESRSYNKMTNSSLDSKKLESLGWKAQIFLAEGAWRTVEGLRELEYLRKQTTSGGIEE